MLTKRCTHCLHFKADLTVGSNRKVNVYDRSRNDPHSAVWGESLFTVCFSVLLCFHRQLFSSSVLGSSFLSLLPPRFFSGPGTLVMLSNRDDQPPLKPHPKPSPPPPPLQLSHQPLPTTIILCTSNCSLSSISHPSFTLLRPSPNAYILSSARQYWILPVPLWI